MTRGNSSSTGVSIRLSLLLALPVILYLIPVGWITGGPTFCLFKNLTGHACYGCGMTRALFSMLHFDFAAAWEYNKLSILVGPLLAYLYAKEVLEMRKRL